MGLYQLYRRRPHLGTTVVAVSGVLFVFISCISFAGGDWCWGPRYMLPILPLWAIAFPFAPQRGSMRTLTFLIVGAGLLVQVLALLVEHQRFFLARGLTDFFWADDPWFYFKHSALLARFEEVVSLGQGVPPTAQWFNSIRLPGWFTYTILGPPPDMPRYLAPAWMREYAIFYLPRPWTLWMWWLAPALRPVSIAAWSVSAGIVGLVGYIIIRLAIREVEDTASIAP
jgi:hypothetical protein